MKAAQILSGIKADGVTLALRPPDALKVEGEQDAVNKWLSVIREHKAGLLSLLNTVESDPVHTDTQSPSFHGIGKEEVQDEANDNVDTLWWRFGVTVSGQRIELDYPSGATLSEASTHARRWYGEDIVIEPLVSLRDARTRPDEESLPRIVVPNFPYDAAQCRTCSHYNGTARCTAGLYAGLSDEVKDCKEWRHE